MSKAYQLPLYRRLLGYAWVQTMLSLCVWAVLKLVWLSLRVHKNTHPDAQPFLRGEQQAIFCFWHGRMILFPFFKPKHKEMYVLISQHRDGELITKLISRFHIKSVRGSTSKGASEAMRALIATLEQGHNIAITPDGPRGPAFEASRGALHLARLSGCPLIPVSYAASHYKQFRSWDRFILPYPFSRIKVAIGAPLRLESDAKLHDLLRRKDALTNALNAMNNQADEVHTA